MIESISHLGEYHHGCPLPGETRTDGVYPGHFNGIQVGRDRFLMVYATRGFRGVDEDRSIVYQLRAGGYDGPVIREGFVARAADDWDVLGDGVKHPRYYGSPVVFGVPRGAVSDGKPAASGNCFAIMARCNPRQLRNDGTLMSVPAADPKFFASLHTAWGQYRLNDAEDDLEVVMPWQPLVPRGGESYRDALGADAETFNVPMVEPVPLDESFTRWAMCINVGCLKQERLRMVMLTWDPASGRYAWTQTGPEFGAGLTEACVLPWGGDWLIAARAHGRPHAAWFRTQDLLGGMPEPVYPEHPRLVGPHTMYRRVDGAVVVFGAPIDVDEGARNPLCMWELDPDNGFACNEPTVVCNVREKGLLDSLPHAEMAKLLPHTGGDTQLIVHRVRTRYTRDATRLGRVIRPDEMTVCGQYYARIQYDRAYPARWRFADDASQMGVAKQATLRDSSHS